MASNNKKHKSSLLFIIIGFFLLVLNFIGIGITGYFSSKNYSAGSNYTSSYNLRYQFDPYAVSNNPADGYNKSVTLTEVQGNMDKIADSYSAILMDEGVNTTNVYTEVYEENGYIYAYLNVTVDASEVSIYRPGEGDDQKEIIAPSLAYYNNMEDADFTILYCSGYNITDSDDSNDDSSTSDFASAKLYLWNLNGTNGLTDSDNKISIDSSNSNQIDVELNNNYSFGSKSGDDGYTSGSIKDVFYQAANSSSDSSNDEESYPFMIIFHNLRGLLNECEYYVYLNYLYNSDQRNEDISNAWWELTDDERQFAKDVIGDDGKETTNNQLIQGTTDVSFKNYIFNTNAGFQPNPYSVLQTNSLTSTSSGNSVSNANSGLYISDNNFKDSMILALLQEHDDNYNPKLGTSTSLGYDFLNKYIVGVVTKDNYLDYLPDNNPKKTTLDSDGKWLTITNDGSYYTTNMLYKQMTEYKFAYPLMDISYPGNDSTDCPQTHSPNNLDSNGLISNGNASLIKNEVTNSIVGISNGVLTTLIALLIIALLIGIVVSVLYRIPGFISWAVSLTPVILSSLIMFALGFSLTISFVLAELVTLLVCNIVGINILNKMKWAYIGHRTLDQALIAAYSKSFFSSIDILIIPLLLGVSVLFFSIGSLFAFGVGLITGCLIGWVFTYFISYLINYLIFGNSIGMYKYKWFSWLKLNNSIATLPNYVNSYASKLNNAINYGFNKDGYISRNYSNNSKNIYQFKNKLISNKWSTLAVWLGVIAIIVAGLTLLFTIGVPQSYSFYGGTRVMLYNDGSTAFDSAYKILIDNASWHNIIKGDVGNFWYLETSSVYDYTTIMGWLSSLSGLTVYVQSINVSTTLIITQNAIYMSLIFLAFIAVYSLIRFNWIAIIPSVLLSVVSIVLTLSLVVICQISFDINIVLILLTIAIMGNVWLFSFYDAILSKWVKKAHPIREELKNMILFGFTSFNDNQYTLLGLFLITSIVGILFMSHEILSLFGIFAIGIVVNYILINFCLMYFIELFSNIKNTYYQHVKRVEQGINKRNFDKVDEELINGININAHAIE